MSAGIPTDDYEPKTSAERWIDRRLPIVRLIVDFTTLPSDFCYVEAECKILFFQRLQRKPASLQGIITCNWLTRYPST